MRNPHSAIRLVTVLYEGSVMTSEEKARFIVAAAFDKKARDAALLDLRGLTLMTDYFFICSGTSSTHIRTVVDSILEKMKKTGFIGIRAEGYDAATWVLIDYGDVVAHVMSPDQREYYDLESFWQDAKRVPLEEESAAVKG